jgi:hypothetical protein
LFVAGATVDRVVAVSTLAASTATAPGAGCDVTNGIDGGPGVVTNSICAGLRGANPDVSCNAGCTSSEVFRNDTLVGRSVGLWVGAGPGEVKTVFVSNTIIHGGTSDVVSTAAFAGASANVMIDHSNYARVDSTSGGTVTPAGSGTNQTAAPVFENAASGDLHEAANSPTVDHGVTNASNGPLDLDGNPRALGASTDIGAYEFVPPKPPPPVAPQISSLQINPSKIRAAGDGATISRKRRTGATVSYVDSEAATTTFVVYRLQKGHRSRIGSFKHSDAAGRNQFHFSARLKGKKLKPGSYVLVGVPTASGLTGRAVSATFKIVL